MGAGALPAHPVVPGVRHRDVRAGAVRLHLAEAGDPAAPPVLLLHGWPNHWYVWRALIGRLGDSARLLMPDNRGFGWSEAPGRGYDPATFAADALALLDALEVERVVLAGHDWGGYVALLLALDHPERIERVVAMSAPHPWVPRSPRVLAGAWRTWYAALLAAAGEDVLRRPRFLPWWAGLGGAGPVLDPDALRSYAEVLRQPDRARAAALLYRAYWRLTRAALRAPPPTSLTMPARLLFGTRDAYVPLSYVDGPEGPAHGLEVELVEGATHWLPEERPDLIAARLRARP